MIELFGISDIKVWYAFLQIFVKLWKLNYGCGIIIK